jgi:hypothetical protein
MYEIGNISVHHSYYLKWKQLYTNYKTSDMKPQFFFDGNKKCI